MRSLLLRLLLAGCGPLVTPVKPVVPSDVVAPVAHFEAPSASEALARLAERCEKSSSRYATVELAGTLSEMVSDGCPEDYTERVRRAVPAIGAKPARDLNPNEISSLRGVR